MTPTAVIFDVGNVLYGWDPESFLARQLPAGLEVDLHGLFMDARFPENTYVNDGRLGLGSANAQVDIGVDAPADKIIGKALEVDAQIIGMSALLTTTMVRQREVIEELDKEGLRPRIKVLVGGAPITKDWAEKIKADGTSEDAVGAVKLAKQLLGKE